jgi:CheY-like chemotaxis protein
MNGYEATRQIKSIRGNIPVIAQTAYSMSEDRKHAIEAGCDEYITKPIDRDELLSKINHFFLK